MSGNKVPLFRPEVLAHKAEAVFGGLLLPRPRAVSLAGYFAAAVLFAIFAAAFFVPIRRHEDAGGWLAYEKGVANVVSTRSGTLVSLAVSEGQIVRKGDVLFVVDTSQGLDDGESLETELVGQLAKAEQSVTLQRDLQKSLHAGQIASARSTANGLISDIKNIRSLEALSAKKLELAQGLFDKSKKLSESRVITSVQLNDAESDYLSALAVAAELSSRRREKEEALARQKSILSSLPLQLQVADAALQSQLAGINQEKVQAKSEGSAVIRAPIDGRVSTLTAMEGDSVKNGDRVLVLVPDGTALQARLLVPTHAAGFVREGQEIFLRYDAFPYQKFGQHPAVIKSISRSVIGAGEKVGPLSVGEPAYLVTAQLLEQSISAYVQEFPLRAGLTLRGSITAESRTLAEWSIEPLLASRGAQREH